MLAVYASIDHPSAERMRLKFALCASVALFILPLLLVTGSRAGLVLGVIGLFAGALLYRHPRRRQPKAWVRSEERSVGQECVSNYRSSSSPFYKKENTPIRNISTR